MGKKQRKHPRGVPHPFASAALVGLSDDELFDKLAVKHLSRAAFWQLWANAANDNSGVRRGLKHPDAAVRATCCQILDHYLDDAAVADIVDCLDDDAPHVRTWALHTLGCDRCKEGACRPGENAFVPVALRMLLEDPSAGVRATAAETLGRSSFRGTAAVLDALEAASTDDPDTHVRRVAARFLPRARAAAR